MDTLDRMDTLDTLDKMDTLDRIDTLDRMDTLCPHDGWGTCQSLQCTVCSVVTLESGAMNPCNLPQDFLSSSGSCQLTIWSHRPGLGYPNVTGPAKIGHVGT